MINLRRGRTVRETPVEHHIGRFCVCVQGRIGILCSAIAKRSDSKKKRDSKERKNGKKVLREIGVAYPERRSLEKRNAYCMTQRVSE